MYHNQIFPLWPSIICHACYAKCPLCFDRHTTRCQNYKTFYHIRHIMFCNFDNKKMTITSCVAVSRRFKRIHPLKRPRHHCFIFFRTFGLQPCTMFYRPIGTMFGIRRIHLFSDPLLTLLCLMFLLVSWFILLPNSIFNHRKTERNSSSSIGGGAPSFA